MLATGLADLLLSRSSPALLHLFATPRSRRQAKAATRAEGTLLFNPRCPLLILLCLPKTKSDLGTKDWNSSATKGTDWNPLRAPPSISSLRGHSSNDVGAKKKATKDHLPGPPLSSRGVAAGDHEAFAVEIFDDCGTQGAHEGQGRRGHPPERLGEGRTRFATQSAPHGLVNPRQLDLESV